LTFVVQPHDGTIHLFLMQYMTDKTLRALPLLLPPAAVAAGPKQTPCSSILDEKNYIARKILLALWYLYVIFRANFGRFRLRARSGICQRQRACRYP
jgi:hypothetical protein